MPKVESREVWVARAKLKINRLALALQYVEKGAGSRKKRHIIATDWLDADGKTITIDVGKKLKGWFKEQMKTLKPSMVTRIQYGVSCKGLPNGGYIRVATIDDVAPSKSWASFRSRENYELNGMLEPEAEFVITVDGRTAESIYYVLKNPVEVEVEIKSFASGVNSNAVEDWLKTLGPMKGIGDKHNSGFGTFELLNFEVTERKELTF